MAGRRFPKLFEMFDLEKKRRNVSAFNPSLPHKIRLVILRRRSEEEEEGENWESLPLKFEVESTKGPNGREEPRQEAGGRPAGEDGT